jgi:hypothetical protein
VGGVSERAGAKAGGFPSSATLSFACRGGRRHPGFPEGGALRGASSERRPRSARSRAQRLPPRRTNAPMTADVRRAPRRGTPSAHALQARAPDAGTRHRRMRHGTRPSLGPSTRARRSSLCSSGRKPVEVGRLRRHRGWANPRKREEPAPGSSEMDVARLAAHHRSQGRRGA